MDSNWQGYRYAAYAGQVLLVGAIVLEILRGEWLQALVLAGFLIAALLFIKTDDRLPNLFDFLFVVAAALNASGWVWSWYDSIQLWDEIAHGFTTFAITLALGFRTYHLLMPSFRDHPWLFVIAIASFGIAIGGLWEIAEWLADFVFPGDVITTLNDTIKDLILDSIGAVLAGWLSLPSLRRESFE
jgi:VanZ family protein